MSDGDGSPATTGGTPETAPGRLRRRGQWLAGITIAWTLAVAVVAIAAGVKASSIALIGLGLESAIELLAAAIVIWQLAGGQKREHHAVRLIGVAFLGAAAYLFTQGIRQLASHAHSGKSAAGLAVAAATVVVMSLLALSKRRTGKVLGSRVLAADAAETALAAVAAAAALAGVGLDTWFGWWWTVPAASLAIAVVAVMEVIEIWAH
jgi:divalent metal cation (Fe/Co/Zn/Cd) transporter